MNGLMSIKCHFCTTHKNKLLCSKWSRRVHATERPQTAEKNTNMSRKTRNCAERRRSRRRMFIFKRLSLKVLSALQDHEWGAGRRGNKNNYTNVSLRLFINIQQYIDAQSHLLRTLSPSLSLPLPFSLSLSLSYTHIHTTHTNTEQIGQT